MKWGRMVTCGVEMSDATEELHECAGESGGVRSFDAYGGSVV